MGNRQKFGIADDRPFIEPYIKNNYVGVIAIKTIRYVM